MVKAKSNINYLGITINEELEPNDAISHAVKRGFTAYGKLKGILRKKATNMKVKRLIYKQLIKPTISYGLSIWPIITEKTFDEVVKCERKILRSVTDKFRRDDGRYYPLKVLYEESGIKDTIIESLNKAKEKYECKKECHRNEWFRRRIMELEETNLQVAMRNMEYKEATRLWKLAKL